MKIDRIKDPKSKEKIELTKSLQNLTYLSEPLNHEVMGDLKKIAEENELDRYEQIYGVEEDKETNSLFLKTDFNKSKKIGSVCYRSPYSNKYYPPTEEGNYPSPIIRNIEEKGSLLFNEYAKLYYGECISNFFVQENQDELCFAFYVQKNKDEQWKGLWNSSSIAEIKGDPSKSISYKITTSVMYEIKDDKTGQSLYGNLKKTRSQIKKFLPGNEYDDFHLMAVGKLIEENQTFIRQQIQSVFILKTKQIIHKTRIAETNQVLEERKQRNREIMSKNQKKMIIQSG